MSVNSKNKQPITTSPFTYAIIYLWHKNLNISSERRKTSFHELKMATISIKTVSNFFIKSVSNKSVIAHSLLRRENNYQTFAAYRAAVLRKVGEPLVIEDVKTQNKLNDTQVH